MRFVPDETGVDKTALRKAGSGRNAAGRNGANRPASGSGGILLKAAQTALSGVRLRRRAFFVGARPFRKRRGRKGRNVRKNQKGRMSGKGEIAGISGRSGMSGRLPSGAGVRPWGQGFQRCFLRTGCAAGAGFLPEGAERSFLRRTERNASPREKGTIRRTKTGRESAFLPA